jgi:hypothetical protein
VRSLSATTSDCDEQFKRRHTHAGAMDAVAKKDHGDHVFPLRLKSDSLFPQIDNARAACV